LRFSYYSANATYGEGEGMASLAQRYVAELVGTAPLVYFGAGAAAITLMIAVRTMYLHKRTMPKRM